MLTDRPDAIGAIEAVLSNLELWVAEHSRRNVFVHAGCAVVDGRAIVLPGRTKTGKTTLSRRWCGPARPTTPTNTRSSITVVWSAPIPASSPFVKTMESRSADWGRRNWEGRPGVVQPKWP